jgi:hypothetical protein
VDWSHIVIAMGAGSVASVCGKVAKAQIQWSFQGDSKTMSTSSHRLPVTDVTDVTDSLGDRPHARAPKGNSERTRHIRHTRVRKQSRLSSIGLSIPITPSAEAHRWLR